MSHGDLYAKAEKVLDELFNDNSVPLGTIKTSLTALVNHTESLLATLDADEMRINARPTRVLATPDQTKKRHIRFAPVREGTLGSAQKAADDG